MTRIAGLTAVVPAGGAGTRLWPLSRESSPKFLLDLTGSGRTLLQQTWDRLSPLAGGGVVVVTGAQHVAAVRAQLPGLPEGAMVGEPAPKDSMPAIGLAAALLLQADPDAVIGSFAADHVVGNGEAFAAAVTEAVTAAQEGWLVTIGIQPTRPATGFGYVQLGEPLGLVGCPTARLAMTFVEKPDARAAESYLSDGGYRWNAGMFVVRADVLLDLLHQSHPDLERTLRAIAQDWGQPEQQETIDRRWAAIEPIAIDHAVAEPAALAGRVACVPADLAWSDIGDWASLADLISPPAPGSPRVLGSGAMVQATDSTGLVVPAGGRRVVVLGLDEVVVVDTPDALLVLPAARAQDVKGVVAELGATGATELL